MKTLIQPLKKMARLLSIGALLVVGSFAIPASATITSNYTVAFTGCMTNGTCYAGVTPSVPSCGCTACDQVRWSVVSGTTAVPGGLEMSRIASAAFLAGKHIAINTTGQCGANPSSYPFIDMLHMAP